jgi:hypothetical protein
MAGARAQVAGARMKTDQPFDRCVPTECCCAPAIGRVKLANSNSGNENLRPETLGVMGRERSSQPGKPTAETGSRRIGYGNVGLFPTQGNHINLWGLRGGGRSPVKPVSEGQIPC